MDDLLARDYGMRPQGRSAPMSAVLPGSSRSPPSDRSAAFNSFGSGFSSSSAAAGGAAAFDDLLGGQLRYFESSSPRNSRRSEIPSPDAYSSPPVYDKPVFDDDVMEGISGVRSSSSERFNDVFESLYSGDPAPVPAAMDDIFENLGKASSNGRSEKPVEPGLPGFEELIPGFGESSRPLDQIREPSETNLETSTAPSSSGINENPFAFMNTASTSASPMVNSSINDGLFDGLGAFDALKRSATEIAPEVNEGWSDKSSFNTGNSKMYGDPFADLELPHRYSSEILENFVPTNNLSDTCIESNHTRIGEPSISSDHLDNIGRTSFLSEGKNSVAFETNAADGVSSLSNGSIETVENIWLSVDEVPLYTEPTRAPPPSRPPPPLIYRHNNPFVQSSQCYDDHVKNSDTTSMDALESFAMGNSQKHTSDKHADVPHGPGEFEKNSSAAAFEAAMKDAMDRAEVKMRHAKVVREKERDARYAKAMESGLDLDGRSVPLAEQQEELDTEQEHINSQSHDIEREYKDREEKMRSEKRREEERQQELERERIRIAVEMATREARERAATEARLKSEKANAEARQRAERLAVQRAAAEARERAQADARVRAERVAAEKAASEARERAAAQERAEAQERSEKAAAEARERAAAQERAEARARAEKEAAEKAASEARERAAAQERAEARARAEKAAVEKVAAEARERAAAQERADARERAEKAEAKQRAERAAVDRAAQEARQRAERAAVERVAQEARQRAERAAVERVAQEARQRAERAAVERAAQEARERAAAAAAAAREQQQRYERENDLEAIFGMGSQASSASKQRGSATENPFDTKFQNGGNTNVAREESSSSKASSMTKPSSASNIDDLTALFGATPSSRGSQEIKGETGERRRQQLEREQRTRERTAKALAEKNERDLQTKREQEERDRVADTLDLEIRRWAAGKEGNMRALLSTLQYILWPELGWAPVSLIDLITPASVKAKYRKATLCVHPDKVQQKGATVQQKYIAEKVFDILKEAWNKFNSEELF